MRVLARVRFSAKIRGLLGGLGFGVFACAGASIPSTPTQHLGHPSAGQAGQVAKTGESAAADGGVEASPESNEERDPGQDRDERPSSFRDPMQQHTVDCGEARPNPYAFVLESPPYPVPPIDGSCATCEKAPEVIPGCAVGEVGQPLSERLTKRKGARVTVAATLAMTGTMCMGVGSQCRCSSKCSSSLSLIPRGQTYESYSEAPLPPPHLTLAWPQRASPQQQAFFERWSDNFDIDLMMHCTGDEASLCCPIDFNREKKLENVVVTGTISEYDDGGGWTKPAIEVERICRPQAAPASSWQVPSGHEALQSKACTGTLTIETNVPVKLTVDHVSRGKSPLRSLKVEAGTHEINFFHNEWGVVAPQTEVEVQCGQDIRKTFELTEPSYLVQGRLEEEARRAALEAELDALPCTGQLHLTSVPKTSAAVDDRYLGETPQRSVRVAPGEHTVRFDHPDFDNETTTVTVACGEKRRIHMKMRARIQ